MSEAEIIQQALAMPLASRIKLASQLMASVREEDEDFDVPQHEIDEAVRLLAEVDAGRIPLIPAADVMRRLRESRHGGD